MPTQQTEERIPARKPTSALSSDFVTNFKAFYLLSSIFYLLPLALLWALLIYHLGAQWSIYEQYNYGWAVPFLCAYLIWRRVQLPNQKSEVPTSDVQPAPSEISKSVSAFQRFSISAFPGSVGLVVRSPVVLWSLFFLWLLAYALTRWLHEANPIWRLTSWLWTLEVIGITLITFRLAEIRNQRSLVVSWSRSLLFPLCFFLVAVPWPSDMETFLVQTFTKWDITLTSELLGILGIPVVQHGNVLEISTGLVGVNEACSGIRSFQATLMIALFFGEIYRLTALRRALCILGGFALAFLFNVGRTLLLVWVASSKGINAIASWHDPAGVTILMGCFIGLWLFALFLNRNRGLNRPMGARASQPAPAPVAKSEEQSANSSEVLTSNSQLLTASIRPISAFQHFNISAFLLAWLIAVEAGTELWYRSHEGGARSSKLEVGRATSETPNSDLRPQTSDFRIRTSDFVSLGITNMPIPETISSQFRADESLEARWHDDASHRWQAYYFRWVPTRSLKGQVTVQLAKTHGPEKCLPAIGMKLETYLGTILIPVSSGSPAPGQEDKLKSEMRTSKSEILAAESLELRTPISYLRSPGAVRLAFQHYVFFAGDERIHVFYGIYEDSLGTEVLANRRENTKQRIQAAIQGSRNNGQRFLELATWGYDNPEAARAALDRELTKLLTTGG